MAYNPLDIKELAASVARAIEASEPVPLGRLPRFQGVGVYALYYRGRFPAYRPLATANAKLLRVPIYVGKAVSSGARIGDSGFEAADRGTDLLDRLRKHASSITDASNLDLADFHARWLVVMPVWVPLGESILIRQYRPLWNSCVDGFGNNDPGGRRRTQYRSEWDTVHPGRPWAALQAEPQTSLKSIEKDIKAHFNNYPPTSPN